eukprot:2465892-Prymnesium_polylepis.1
MSSALLFLLASPACDVSYDFGESSEALVDSLSVTLTWWQVLPQPSQQGLGVNVHAPFTRT